MMCQKIIFLSKRPRIHGRTAFQNKRLFIMIFQKIDFFISGIFDDTAEGIGFSKTHGQWSMSYLMFILVDKGIFHRISHKFSQIPFDRMLPLLYHFIRKPENGIPDSLQKIHRHHDIFPRQKSCFVPRCHGWLHERLESHFQIPDFVHNYSRY